MPPIDPFLLHTQRFLIVSNQSVLNNAIKHTLHSLGFHQIQIATSATGALEQIRQTQTHIIISDWNLPDRSGLELLKAVRAHPLYHAIAFMLITSQTSRQQVVTALQEGVNDLLVKPFSSKTLRDKVERILHNPTRRMIDHLRTEEPSSPATYLSEGEPPRTVLIVDDAADNLELFSTILREEYQIKAATNGAKALRIARDHPDLDLILLDVMMPNMDGFEVCRQLKERYETESIPVIFLTAKAEVTDITQGFALGAVDYITKPVKPAILRARVKTHTCLKRVRDQLKLEVDTLADNIRLHQDLEQMASCNIKRPLTRIIQFSDQLLESKSMSFEPKQQVDQIRIHAYEILSLVNQSQELHQIERGIYQMHRSRFDAVTVSYKVIELVRHEIQREKQTNLMLLFEAPEQLTLESDEMIFFSMLENLLWNGIALSPQQGRMTLKLSQIEQQIRFDLLIPALLTEATLGYLFNKYINKHPIPIGKHGGAYAAQLMARLQGGEIIATANPPQGTLIQFELPCGSVEASGPKSLTAAPLSAHL